MITIAGGVLLALTLGGPVVLADTTITVPAGSRLDVESTGGRIAVETWNRNEVRVQASHGSRDRIRVDRDGPVVRVRADRSGVGVTGIVDYTISVPAQTDLALSGVHVEILVSGPLGQVNATTIQGPITVTGGAGRVAVQTVQGAIVVEGARNGVQAQSVAGAVSLRDIDGPVDAQTVSGRLVMEEVRSTSIDAATVSGRIFFDGNLVRAGRYSFTTHSGTITVAVQENLNATVTVALISGGFNSSIAALSAVGVARGQRQSHIVGDGSAMLELESFSGRISVVRRGEASPP